MCQGGKTGSDCTNFEYAQRRYDSPCLTLQVGNPSEVSRGDEERMPHAQSRDGPGDEQGGKPLLQPIGDGRALAREIWVEDVWVVGAWLCAKEPQRHDWHWIEASSTFEDTHNRDCCAKVVEKKAANAVGD